MLSYMISKSVRGLIIWTSIKMYVITLMNIIEPLWNLSMPDVSEYTIIMKIILIIYV